jgi:hypothetical protein
MNPNPSNDSVENDGVSAPEVPAGEEQSLAWELIDSGRYMPRRIRGSCRGRVLG